MIVRKYTLGCVAILMLPPAVAICQPRPSSEFPAVNYQPMAPLPPGSGEFYHHDSTLTGNRMRGIALLMYAQGAYRVNCAQAAVLTEYRQSLALYNRQQADEYYDARRQQAELRHQEEVSRQQFKHSKARLPKRDQGDSLANDSFDRTTGAISWPKALEAVEFDTDRANLEFLFRKLVSGMGRPASNSALIAEYTERMGSSLDSDNQKINRSEYVTAKKFLIALKHAPEEIKPIDAVASISALK